MARERRLEDFGSQLRLARERKGVSLRAIADATRIAVAALEGLERNDISRLPGGIFSRGFVRAYAQQVGLDPDATVDEFVRCFPDDSVTDGHPAAVRARIIDDVNEIRRRRTPRLARLTMVLVPAAALALYLLVFGWPGRRSTPIVSTTGSAPGATRVPCQPPYRVELRARTTSTISYEKDGEPRQDVVLPAMSRRTFEVVRDLALQVADAGAIDLIVNGVARPALGAAGAPTSVHITDFCAEVATP